MDKKYVISAILILLIGTVVGVSSLWTSESNQLAKEERNSNSSNANSAGFWWPIGSLDTTTKDGKEFASGTPELGKSSISRAGGGPDSAYTIGEGHSSAAGGYAIDIVSGDGISGKHNVISAGKGTVTYTNNSYTGKTSSPDFGNCIYVDYGNGIVFIYAHLHHDSITVEEGDEVDYGQVIAKMGDTGYTTCVHLHMAVSENGTMGDITKYIDPDNPRPTDTNTPIGDIIGGGSVTEVSGQAHYTKKITVGDKTYTVWDQFSYSSPYYGNGCGPTSMATLLSAYGYDYDVIAAYNKFGAQQTISTYASQLTKLGISATSYTEYDKSKINTTIERLRETLTQGREAIILVRTGPDNYFTTSAHYMLLVGITESDQAVICNSVHGRVQYMDLTKLVTNYIYSTSSYGYQYLVVNETGGEE